MVNLALLPINLYRSDIAATEFGDQNNFNLSGQAFDLKTYRKSSIQIQSPANEILYKLCTAR